MGFLASLADGPARVAFYAAVHAGSATSVREGHVLGLLLFVVVLRVAPSLAVRLHDRIHSASDVGAWISILYMGSCLLSEDLMPFSRVGGGEGGVDIGAVRFPTTSLDLVGP